MTIWCAYPTLGGLPKVSRAELLSLGRPPPDRTWLRTRQIADAQESLDWHAIENRLALSVPVPFSSQNGLPTIGVRYAGPSADSQ